MKMEQIAALVNTIAAETVGNVEGGGTVQENLNGVVDVGKTISNAIGWEQFTNTIVDKIGQTIMVSREYDSAAPDILHRGTAIPYGSVTEKVRVKLPEATTNDSWPVGETWTPGEGWTDATKPTNDNANPFITVRPEVEATYFNGGTTFEIDMTFPTIQMMSGFKNAADYRRFFDTVENRIFQAKTVFKDGLIKRTVNNLIAEKLYARQAVVDILDMYNTAYGLTGEAALTATAAIYDKAFLRYAGYAMGLYKKRLRRMSRRYNTAGYDTFTPLDRLRFITLDMFSDAIVSFMQSDTYHDELVGLGDGFSTVECWQTGGTGGVSFETSAALNLITGDNHAVLTGAMGAEGAPIYVVGTMFDIEAAWVDFDEPRVTSQYNARKEQTTFFYKENAHYCNDLAENCVVFTLGTPAPLTETKTRTIKK